MKVLLLLLLSIIPSWSNIIVDRVDYIEFNHFYDEKGRLVFDQYIFWDDHVREWRMVKDYNKFQFFEHNGGRYVRFVDGEIGGPEYKIYYTSVQETWTQFDPELADRVYLDKDKRIKFGGYLSNGQK